MVAVPLAVGMRLTGCFLCMSCRIVSVIVRGMRRRPWRTLFIIFLLGGFNREGNVKRPAQSAADVERIDARRAEIDKIGHNERMTLFQEHLETLRRCPIVSSASSKEPANKTHFNLNAWGVCFTCIPHHGRTCQI